MSNPPTPAPSASAPCRVLLRAVADALSLPPPATANDEVTYLRLSRDCQASRRFAYASGWWATSRKACSGRRAPVDISV